MIRSTFLPFHSSSTPLPELLVSDLIIRFSSARGYKLYWDVLPFFQKLREGRISSSKSNTVFPTPTIGVITNSDERVPSILSSLGLQVGPHRHGVLASGSNLEAPNHEDINFVAMSYDNGFEKPDGRIFDAARQLGSMGRDIELHECLHIGDHPEKDFRAAQENSLILSREDCPDERNYVRNLLELAQILYKWDEIPTTVNSLQ